MKRILCSLATLLLAFSYAIAQDVIVKKDGTILNVYNLGESDNYYFFTLEPSADAATQKISKSDVFSAKKNGVTSTQQAEAVVTENNNSTQHKRSEKEPVTAQISSKPIDGIFTAQTPDGHELNYQILSREERTLTVTKGKYHEEKYIIPEYVKIDNEIYTVTEIGEKAFFRQGKVIDVQFPTTLKKIGENAFRAGSLERILLPENLETLEDCAFYNIFAHVNEIYIPSTIKRIGANCFLLCGTDRSYRGFCQAYFSNMPDFITEGNCLGFGIDEEAVRAFQNRRR